MTIPTPRKMDDWLFLTCFYNGSWMLRLDASKPAAATVRQSQRVSEMNTDALHSTLSTPFLQDGYIYGVCSYGQLRRLNAATGERVWETLGATHRRRQGNAPGQCLHYQESGPLLPLQREG
jgi:outer membrane protein assembly factor BamB